MNVILAHGENDKCPVVFETIPTYSNLFGTIHRSYDARGSWNSDFMDLRGGSLLRADGGFIVMYAVDALTETGVWRTLKRTLNHGKLEIQPLDVFFPFSTGALKPEPIDIHVKVILIGDRDMYELLYDYEDDFKKIFKVRVEFDEEMKWSDAVLLAVRRAPAKTFRRRKASALRPRGGGFHSGAWRAPRGTPRQNHDAILRSCRSGARVVLCGDATKGATVVTADHVREALDAKIERHNLLETKLREMIEQNLVFHRHDGRTRRAK